MPRPKRLKLAPNLTLPQEAVTQTFGFIAKKGGGKTYAAGKLAEELYGIGAPFVVLDPVGNWYGLRLSASGRKPGLPIYVFGGDHGDLPITPDSGAIVARAVMKRGIAAVIDVSRFRKGQRKKFVADFAEELFHLAKTIRSPLMVIFEEAQVFAPQRAGKGEERMLGAVEDIVRLGRNYGLGSALITQRPQSVHKDVLNQVECLFVGQLSGKHERVAIDGWIEQHGVDLDTKELSALPVGTMFVWSPQWLKRFGKVRIAAKMTYDASATPTLGKRRRIGTLAKVDLATLETDLQGVVEEAEADDPQALKQQLQTAHASVAALQKQLKERPPERVIKVLTVDPKAVALLKQLQQDVAEVQKVNSQLQEVCQRAAERFDHWQAPPEEAPAPAPPERVEQAPKPPPSGNGASTSPAFATYSTLPRVERLMLQTLAQHDPRPLDLSQVAIYAGYSPKTSSVKNGLGALRSRGVIMGPNSSMRITESGRQLVGNTSPLATGPVLAGEWLRRLGKCDRTMLQAIIDAYPNPLNLAEVADATGYSSSTSSVKNGLGHLRRLKLIEGLNDSMTANEILIQ